MSVLGLVAIGQTLVVLGASLDLSVTYVISLSSLLAATMMNDNAANIPVAVIVTLLVCAGVGLVNGLIVTVLKVNGFIATLGVGLILQGIPQHELRGIRGEGALGVPAHRRHRSRPHPGLHAHHDRAGRRDLGAPQPHPHRRPPLRCRRRPRDRPALRSAHPGCLSSGRTCSAQVFAGLAGLLLASRLGVGSPTVGQQGRLCAALDRGGRARRNAAARWTRAPSGGTIGGVAILAVVDNRHERHAGQPVPQGRRPRRRHRRRSGRLQPPLDHPPPSALRRRRHPHRWGRCREGGGARDGRRRVAARRRHHCHRIRYRHQPRKEGRS